MVKKPTSKNTSSNNTLPRPLLYSPNGLYRDYTGDITPMFSYGEFGDIYECRNKSFVLDLLCVNVKINVKQDDHVPKSNDRDSHSNIGLISKCFPNFRLKLVQ